MNGKATTPRLESYTPPGQTLTALQEEVSLGEWPPFIGPETPVRSLPSVTGAHLARGVRNMNQRATPLFDGLAKS
ncbi:MAG TPA: hypothetical protein VKZ41_11350, partial [Gemmatimonadales bacterium]|nr:hypothetical protein [Gemmatimonadales bacterium]